MHDIKYIDETVKLLQSATRSAAQTPNKKCYNNESKTKENNGCEKVGETFPTLKPNLVAPPDCLKRTPKSVC